MRSIFPADRRAKERENERKGELLKGQRKTEKVINSGEMERVVTDAG